MAKKPKNDIQAYGAELGVGIKQGLQGLNTVCSPKSRKKAILLILVPLALFIACLVIGTSRDTMKSSGLRLCSGCVWGCISSTSARSRRDCSIRSPLAVC